MITCFILLAVFFLLAVFHPDSLISNVSSCWPCSCAPFLRRPEQVKALRRAVDKLAKRDETIAGLEATNARLRAEMNELKQRRP